MSRYRTGYVVVFSIAMCRAACAQSATPPTRTDDNLIVASYNIQFFGEKPHDIANLATVIQHFDVCGVVELKRETALQELTKELSTTTGKDWGYVFGVRTHRPRGKYHEAYGAVYRRDRVQLGDGLIGGAWDLEEAFRNDPYWVSFKRKGFDFTMMLLHTRWTNDDEGTRANEVAMIAEQVNWMKENMNERDILVAGDFNYAGAAEAMDPLREDADMAQLDADPKSTFKANGDGFASAYDHMFVLDGHTGEYVDDSCDTLDVCKLVYGDNSPANMKKARSKLSDHLPVFAVFDVSGTDDD